MRIKMPTCGWVAVINGLPIRVWQYSTKIGSVTTDSQAATIYPSRIIAKREVLKILRLSPDITDPDVIIFPVSPLTPDGQAKITKG